jgi:hypothetical protein
MQELILNSEVKILATQLAEKTYARFANFNGHYRNTASNHLVGHLGEFAAFAWFQDQNMNPIPHFIESARGMCDIDTSSGRFEIKTWSERYWDSWGRSISVSQYASIKKKADYIFFCTADEVESDTPKITFRGWCDVNIVETKEPKITGSLGREVLNYQLEKSDLKDVGDLV